MIIKLTVHTEEVIKSYEKDEQDKINAKYKSVRRCSNMTLDENELIELLSMKYALEHGIDNFKKVEFTVDSVTLD